MIVSIWKKILRIGNSPELRGIEKTRVMLLNGVGAFVLLILAIYSLVLVYFKISPLFLAIPLPVIVTAFYLNFRKEYDAARITVIFGSILAFVALSLLVRRSGVEYALITTACSAPLIFRKVTLSYITLVLSAIGFAYVKYFDATTPFIPKIIHEYPIFPIANLYISIGVVFFQMLIFRDLTRHYANKLSKKNAQLDGSLTIRNEFESKLRARNDELSELNSKLDMEMQAKSKELQAYIDAININIIVSLTDHSGRIISVNDKFCKLSGYTRAELRGQDHNILNSGFHRDVFFEHLYSTINSGKSWQGKIRNKSKDGSIYWVDTVILPVMDKNNEVERFLSLQQDITELKVAEQKRSAYFRALEDIAFHTSHEIRRPLANILGLIHIIEEENIEQSELESVAKGLKQSMKDLDDATTGLYKFIHGNK